MNSEVIISKAALAFRSCYDEFKEGRVRSDGLVSNGPRKKPSLPKTFGQVVYFRNLEIFKWNGQTSNDEVCVDTALTLQQAFSQVKNKKTDRRSNWETTFSTFCDIAKFPSKTDFGRDLFSSFAGKIVLQGTMSNRRATEHLSCSFAFLKVIDCENFFKYVLEKGESFDAIVDNPPWDIWFLKIYFRFLWFSARLASLSYLKKQHNFSVFSTYSLDVK